MHLKTLTLRGFKSFASATTLNFEPGITCVVGPNGSGKSNVVDALAWVMGEQGAKSLRGGKMEDVIFAGTAARPPLGRAEVTLTIDNTDGALPIDYTEVTIARTLFRNGGSEYAINGTPCRLLDIQDLLSDSGLGREMHVIVGQGRLDAILYATPEERRGFIEEAAGVLKHRKRKEKALRKLEAMQANLTRVQDLTTELRRQLGPLAKQAQVARKARTIQADVRDAKARLLADDLVQLTSALAQDIADEEALRRRRGQVETALADARTALIRTEQRAAAAAPRYAAIAETWYRLSSLREQVRAAATLASERARLLAAPAMADRPGGREPEELDTQAAQVRASEHELLREVDSARAALAEAVERRADAERAHAEEERRLAALLRAAADKREGLARMAGRVGAKRSRVEAAEAEIGRLRLSLAAAGARQEAAQAECAELEASLAGVESGEESLNLDYERAVADHEHARAEWESWQERQRAAEKDCAAAQARADALRLALARKDGTQELLAVAETLPGILGSLAALVTVDVGYEDAIAAALGPAADALAVASLPTAIDAIRHLRTEDGGRAAMVVGSGAPPVAPAPVVAGLVRARDVVSCPTEIAAAVDVLLRDVVVVDGLLEARVVCEQSPELVAVTRGGDVVSNVLSVGGSTAAPSVIAVQAALDEAEMVLNDALSRHAQASREAEAAQRLEAQTRTVREEWLEKLRDSNSQLTAAAEQLGRLGVAVRAAADEAARLAQAVADAEATRDEELATLAELADRLEFAEDDEVDEPDTAERDRLVATAQAARQREMELRLTLRTGEERVQALSGRADSLEQAAAAAREARRQAAELEQSRAAQARVARAVRVGADHTLAVLEHSLFAAARARELVDAQRQRDDHEVSELRRRVDELGAQLSDLTDGVHRDEVQRAEQRLRIEQIEQRAVDELGLTSDVLVDEFGPDRLIPAPAIEDPDAAAPPPRPYVRDEQAKRLRTAERQLAQLGRVNPLALEEYAALEERHRFLQDQLTDLKKSRSDLLNIVAEIDERVEEVFTAAWHDTEREFRSVFASLFPGGEGALILTDPSNMLGTGIDVEARPAGKKVKRLSLLSGGERSLTAIAMLVAIFKARPSPFYVMDEVEAALDDVNLGRLLGILEELRESSQLIVVTHQKRTMEVADALYGVTMRGDGVTSVISQRIRQDA